jgi:hypothetical protein
MPQAGHRRFAIGGILGSNLYHLYTSCSLSCCRRERGGVSQSPAPRAEPLPVMRAWCAYSCRESTLAKIASFIARVGFRPKNERCTIIAMRV